MDKNMLLRALDFNRMLENTSEMVLVIDGQGDFLYANEAWKRSLAYEEEDLLKLDVFELIVSLVQEEKRTFMNKVMAGNRFKEVGLKLLAKTGKEISVKGNIFSIFNENGEIQKVVGLFREVRDLKEEEAKEENFLKVIHAERKFKSEELNKIDYQGITNLMKDLSEAKYVSFNLYEEKTGSVITKATAGDVTLVKKIEDILGFEIKQIQCWRTRENKKWTQEKTAVLIEDLLDVTPNYDENQNIVGRKNAIRDEIGGIVRVNMVREGRSLGDFIMIMDQSRLYNPYEMVKLFAFQIGLLMANIQTEKMLKKNNQKMHHTLEATGAATWEWNLLTDEVVYSRQWYEMLGYEAEDLKGNLKQWEKLCHPDDQEMIKRNVQEYLTGKTEHYEVIHRLRTKNQGYKWIMARGSLLKDEVGKERFFRGFHIDVTHTRKEEEKRIIETKKLQNTLEATNAGTWEWNVLTGTMTYNERWAEIIGYSLEEISPISTETFKQFAHPEDYEKSQREVKGIFNKEKEFYSIECRMIHKDGRVIWVLDKGKVISWTSDGKPAVMFGTHIDITDSKTLELEIKDSEEKYKILVESSYDIIFHIDMGGNITYVSKAWTQQLGHPLDVIGKPFKQYIHPEDIQKIWDFFGGVKKSSERMEATDYRILHKDGEWHWFNINVTALWNEYGANVGFAGTARDVTEMKRTSRKLREQKDELEQFFTVNLDLFCILSPHGYFLKLNLPWERDLGYHPDYLLSRPVLDFVHEDDRRATKAAYDTMIANKKEIEVVCRIRRSDGTYRILEWKAQYHEGLVYAAARDVTKNKLLEESLHLEKELFRTTLLSVGDGVIATDHEGKIKIMNEAAQAMTGWTQHEAFGCELHDVYTLYQEKSKTFLKNHVQEVIIKGRMKKYEDIILVNKNETVLPIEDRSSPIKDSRGQITGAVIVFRDVTDKQEKQKQNDYLINHDALTGLYNRRFLDNAMKKVERSRHLPLTVMVVDVNGLKLTNDAFGHHVGDELLKSVAEILREVSREEDIAARVGGDEFVMLLPKTDFHQAELIKKKILKRAKEKESHPIMLSFGIGYAVKIDKTQNLKEVQKMADNNMYKDKLKFGKIMKGKMVREILKNVNDEFPTEKKHLENVEVYCGKLAKALGYSSKEISRVMNAGRLHDIGKVSIPKEILEKPGRLTSEEYEIIKRHTEVSYQILKSVDEFAMIAEDVLYHHERIDGSGYPEGLKGQDIPITSKIISVVDSYDAMVGNRSYQRRKTMEEAIAELRRCAGTQFDPFIVEVFIEKVLLSND